MRELIVCALRNIGRKKLRAALTIIGIAIGVASVILIGAVGEGGKTAVSGELDSLGVNGLNIRPQTDRTGDADTMLLPVDVQTCAKVSGVEDAMPVVLQTGASMNRGITKSVLLWGIGSDAGNVLSLKIKHGRMFSAADVQKHSRVCVVDTAYARAFFGRENITGQTVLVYMGNGYQKLRVAGVAEQGSSLVYNLVGSYIPSFVYVPYTTAEDLRGKQGFDQIAIKTAGNQNLDATGSKIVALLEKIHGGSSFVVDNLVKQKEKLAGLLSIVTLIISAIGAISLVVAGLSIMTVMTVSVSERTREIGIKKAIGATRRTIRTEFLFEAAFLSLIGSAAGVAAGMGIAGAASLLLHLSLPVKPAVVLYSTGFASGIGVLFGVYPAIVASRMKPVDALRQE